MQHSKLTPIRLPGKGDDGFCDRDEEQGPKSREPTVSLTKPRSRTGLTIRPEKHPNLYIH